MCQMSVFLRKKNMALEEKIADNVALLEMTGNAATISSLFETNLTVEGVRIERIDFMKGKIVLEETTS